MAFGGYISADQVIPDGSSKAEVWENWYELIPGSRQTKNTIWLQAWSKWADTSNSDVNSSGLRDYMKRNAGIEITTDGIGSIIDATKSTIDSVEDFAMMPLYVLVAGAAVIFGLGGFMVYQGVKNPEAAGTFVGSAGKAVLLKDGGEMSGDNNKQEYWLYGATALITIAFCALYYVRNQNQIVVNNIMAALSAQTDPVTTDSGLSGGGAKKNLTDLSHSNIFVPSWWTSAPEKVTIVARNGDGSPGNATLYADRIYNANAPGVLNWVHHPEDVVAVFKNLKTKQDVSKLADVFEAKYKTNLYNWLTDSTTPWMTGGCAATEDKCFLGARTNYMKQVYDWITNHLS